MSPIICTGESNQTGAPDILPDKAVTKAHQKAQGWKPRYGEPYRPHIQFPKAVLFMNEWFQNCTMEVVYPIDPPRSLVPADGMATAALVESPAAVAPKPTPKANQDKDPYMKHKEHGLAPASIPKVDQPKHTQGPTSNEAKVNPKIEESAKNDGRAPDQSGSGNVGEGPIVDSPSPGHHRQEQYSSSGLDDHNPGPDIANIDDDPTNAFGGTKSAGDAVEEPKQAIPMNADTSAKLAESIRQNANTNDANEVDVHPKPTKNDENSPGLGDLKKVDPQHSPRVGHQTPQGTNPGVDTKDSRPENRISKTKTPNTAPDHMSRIHEALQPGKHQEPRPDADQSDGDRVFGQGEGSAPKAKGEDIAPQKQQQQQGESFTSGKAQNAGNGIHQASDEEPSNKGTLQDSFQPTSGAAVVDDDGFGSQAQAEGKNPSDQNTSQGQQPPRLGEGEKEPANGASSQASNGNPKAPAANGDSQSDDQSPWAAQPGQEHGQAVPAGDWLDATPTNEQEISHPLVPAWSKPNNPHRPTGALYAQAQASSPENMSQDSPGNQNQPPAPIEGGQSHPQEDSLNKVQLDPSFSTPNESLNGPSPDVGSVIMNHSPYSDAENTVAPDATSSNIDALPSRPAATSSDDDPSPSTIAASVQQPSHSLNQDTNTIASFPNTKPPHNPQPPKSNAASSSQASDSHPNDTSTVIITAKTSGGSASAPTGEAGLDSSTSDSEAATGAAADVKRGLKRLRWRWRWVAGCCFGVVWVL